MTLKQRYFIIESAHEAASYNDARRLTFPRSIQRVTTLPLTITGNVILLAFDDAAIGLQKSTTFQDFCRECCRSMYRRGFSPDWNFVAYIAETANIDLSAPKTLNNTFKDVLTSPRV